MARDLAPIVKRSRREKGALHPKAIKGMALSSEWRIVDVISGGVSQLALQRADLASTAAAGVPAIVKKLGQLDAVK